MKFRWLNLFSTVILIGLSCNAMTTAADQNSFTDAIQIHAQYIKEIRNKALTGEAKVRARQWSGRYHQALQHFAQEAWKLGLNRQQIEDLIGPADTIVEPNSSAFAHAEQLTQWQGKPTGNWHSYFWRGQHDQLLFAFDGQTLTGVGWLYSYE